MKYKGTTNVIFFKYGKYSTKKINIYGWDFNLKKSPKNFTYLDLYNSFYNFSLDQLWYHNKFFEMNIMHWLFASRLKKIKHIRIQGYLNDVSYFPSLLKKINKVYYN